MLKSLICEYTFVCVRTCKLKKGKKRITSLKMMVNTAIKQPKRSTLKEYSLRVFAVFYIHSQRQPEVELHFNETNPAFKHSTSTWPKATFGLMLFPRC